MLCIAEAVREIAKKLYLGLGYRLPPFVRNSYLMDVYDKANRAYVPEVYPGRLVIYKDEGSSDPRLWGAFAAEGFEIHEVPGDHINVLAEENVKVWGKQLSADLHRAQAELRGFEGRHQRSEVAGQVMDGEAQRAKSQAQRGDTSDSGHIADFGLREVS